MHFGKWIVVSFVLFALFIGTLVTLCVREDISLVSKEYYKEELAYQEQLQRLNNVAQLEHQPVIEFASQQQQLRVFFGENAKIESGEMKLFCPSNANLDKQYHLQSTSEQVFKMTKLKKGLYKVKLFWVMEGKEYYYEREIFIG